MAAASNVHDPSARSHQDRGWGRVLLRGAGYVLAVIAALLVLFVLGPGWFILVFACGWLLNPYIGREGRRMRRARARLRRRENLTRAIDRGGLDTAPPPGRRRSRPEAPERTAMGPSHTKVIHRWWMRGRL